jgi:hypothetical protein
MNLVTFLCKKILSFMQLEYVRAIPTQTRSLTTDRNLLYFEMFKLEIQLSASLQTNESHFALLPETALHQPWLQMALEYFGVE